RLIDPDTLERARTRAPVDTDATLRTAIERFTPDPRETGTASQIIFGAGKVVGKALGYGMVGGFPGAVVGTGVDEAVSETLRLQDKGVDAEPAGAAGTVHGLATAAGIALPIVGRTAVQTAGLVAAGGPGLFMAEQAAVHKILDAADYKQVAESYDPFDTVG